MRFTAKLTANPAIIGAKTGDEARRFPPNEGPEEAE